MLHFLEEIFEVLRDWHIAEGRALRRAALLLIGFPFLLIALGAVAEGLLHSFHAKIFFISLANIWMGIIFAWMAVRRVIIAAEVGVPILSASRTGDDPTPRAVVDAAMYYARGVAAILASETAAGLVVALLPVYANMSAALLVLSTSITFISWWVWRQKGVERWASIVYNLACANAMLGLLLIISSAYLPESFATIFSLLGGADARLVSITKLEADVVTVAKMLVAVLVGFYLATAFAREKLQVRTFLQRLAVIAVISLVVIIALRVQKGESKEEKSVKDFVTSMGRGKNPTTAPSTTPSASPKEEKRVAAVKEKRWQKQLISEANVRKASSWSLPALPAIHFSMRRGQIFPWPAGGEGMCAGVFLEAGEFKDPESESAMRFISWTDCHRDIRIECASASCRGFAGYAFDAPHGGIATLVER